MANALDRLRALKQSADDKQEVRRNYQRFINGMRDYRGWSQSDIDEYAASVKIIMSGTEEEVMALYPAGMYGSAKEIRDAAENFWKEWK